MAKKKGVANKGSWNYRLEAFEVGEQMYIGTTLEKYRRKMSVVCNSTRFTKKMKDEGYKFSVKLFTAIGSELGDIRYLLCIERIN